MEASFSSSPGKARVSSQNKEGREGRRLVMGVDVVRSLLSDTQGQGCCEIPMKIPSKPLSI